MNLKVVSCCLISSLALGGVCHGEDEVSANEHYSGWFLGVGVGYHKIKNDWKINDNLRSSAKDKINSTPAMLQGILAGYGSVDAFLNNLDLQDVSDRSLGKVNKGNVGLDLIAGYGDFPYEDFYLGGEVGLFVSKDKDQDNDNKIGKMDYEHVKVKTRGLVFTVAARIGYRISCIDTLVYLRGGVCTPRSKFDGDYFSKRMKKNSNNKSFENSGVSPLVGIAIEKNICKGCNLNFGVDYHFAANKEWEFEGVNGNDKNFTKLKNKNNGWAAHFTAVHYF